MNHSEIVLAYKEWESFVNNLTEEEKKGLIDFSESIEENNMHYYIAIKDTIRFDQTINRLSKEHKFSLDLIPNIYNFYIDRELNELGFDYLNKTEEYFNEMGITPSSEVQYLFDNAEDTNLFKKLKLGLEKIRTLKAKNIPFITPNILNDKNQLSEFILDELVQASKVLIEKIEGIKKNPDEDRYNDLLLAILRLRFQLWGWSIHDQARTGTSRTGKSAGETDLTIQSANITITLFEALILEGKNRNETQKHILKTFDYSKNLDRYYMIIYFKGKPDKFESTWNSYKKDASESSFKTNYKFNTAKRYEDLSNKFEDVRHLKIAKSIHGKNTEMFHVMIDLSE